MSELNVTRHRLTVEIVTDVDLKVSCACGWSIVIDTCGGGPTVVELHVVGSVHLLDALVAGGMYFPMAHAVAHAALAPEAEVRELFDGIRAGEDGYARQFPALARIVADDVAPAETMGP